MEPACIYIGDHVGMLHLKEPFPPLSSLRSTEGTRNQRTLALGFLHPGNRIFFLFDLPSISVISDPWG